MSETDYTIEQDSDSDLVRDLRAQLKNKLAENKSLKSENDTFKASSRANSVADVLKESGLSPKLAKLIPPNVEATKEAIAKWVQDEDLGDVFNIPAAAESNATEAATTDSADAPDFAALARAQATSHDGSAVQTTGLQAQIKAMEEAFQSAGSLDALTAAINGQVKRT